VWERAPAKCGWQTLLPHPTSTSIHTPVCPLLLVLGTVSPCVQRWAARWHPPPALGEHPQVELEGADAAVGWWERGVYGESGLR
jgi:hypothetical protein